MVADNISNLVSPPECFSFLRAWIVNPNLTIILKQLLKSQLEFACFDLNCALHICGANQLTSFNMITASVVLKAQFSHCPLVWMCCSRSLKNKINRLNERKMP